MLLREVFESAGKTAVLAFGRLNPPTVGHAKLVDAITSQEGDHYLFLSQTQKPKTDPLDFATKMKFAKQFFPGVNVGHQGVRTPVQALEKLQSLGYTDIIFIAGSDRVDGFQKLFDTYNGQPDKTGNVPFKFNSIKVVSAGERDPDADDVSGMSASKMRAAAAAGDLESFAQGVPDKKLAQTMYDAVRKGMGVKDAVPAEGVEEGMFGLSAKEKGAIMNLTSDLSDIPGMWDFEAQTFTDAGKEQLTKLLKNNSKHIKYALNLTSKDYEAEGVAEAAYEGNIGIMELMQFFTKAGKEAPELVSKVKELIKQKRDKEVWKIVQDYTGTKLKGAEFEGSIIDEILGFATKNPKRATIKKKRPPEEDSVKDKLAKRRAMAAKGNPDAFKSGKLNDDAPPGREKQVKKLKKKFDDPGAPYAIAWAQHNKHGKPKK